MGFLRESSIKIARPVSFVFFRKIETSRQVTTGFSSRVHFAGVDVKVTPSNAWTSCRYILAFVGMGASTIQYVLRFSFSVAVVCMVKPDTPELDLNLTLQLNITEPGNDPCGVLQNARRSYSNSVSGTFHFMHARALIQM